MPLGKRVPYKNKPSILKKWSEDGSTSISPAKSKQPADTENISALDHSSAGKVTENNNSVQTSIANAEADKKETVAKTEPQQPNNAISDGSSLSTDAEGGITSAEPNGEPTVSAGKVTEKENSVQTSIANAEQETETDPSEAQKKAGNYKKGHVKIDGFDVTIENPKGSMRRGTDEGGNRWEQEMHNTYGNNRLVLIELSPEKENAEIEHWHYIDDKGLEKIKRQAEREDGQLLILPSEPEEAGALSSPTNDLPSGGKVKEKNNFAQQGSKETDKSDKTDIPGRTDAALAKEEADIISKAKADGTYLKAPNGKPTNLTPRQWVQVRTKAFKKWFGDWEKLARIEKLRKSKSVVRKDGEYKGRYELNSRSAEDYVITSLRGEYKNNDTGDVIKITRASRKVAHHDAENYVHLMSIAYIPEMIENAVFIEKSPNGKGSKFDSYRYHVVGLKIDGVHYTAKLVVGSKNGESYYDHSLTEIEKKQSHWPY